jgi:Flp pilus assembly pilin Flp
MRGATTTFRCDERGTAATDYVLVTALAAVAAVAAMTAAGVSVETLLDAVADQIRAVVGDGDSGKRI